MSRIITNNIRHNDATSDSLSLDSAGNVSAPGNLSVTGTSTFTDDLAVDTDTLFVDVSTDRVGINTTSPRNALHALSSNGDIRIDTSTNGGAAGLIFDVPATNGLRASGHRAKIQCEHTGSGWDSNLIFYGGNTSTEPSEQLRITSDNYLRMASGTNGIQFHGDTAAANALDDYEEGTWTPTITSGYTSITYNSQHGWYTKVGRLAVVSGRIQFSGTANSTFIQMGNLPFTAANLGGGAYGGGGIPYSSVSEITNTSPYVGGNTNYVIFHTLGAGSLITSSTSTSSQWISFVVSYSV